MGEVWLYLNIQPKAYYKPNMTSTTESMSSCIFSINHLTFLKEAVYWKTKTVFYKVLPFLSITSNLTNSRRWRYFVVVMRSTIYSFKVTAGIKRESTYTSERLNLHCFSSKIWDLEHSLFSWHMSTIPNKIKPLPKHGT